MAPFRNLAATTSLAVATFASLASADCKTICHFGGHNTSCTERIKWVHAHVDNWDRVVKIPDTDKKLTCTQSRDKVLQDCPICAKCPMNQVCCSMNELCEFQIGDLVSALYYPYDDKWHIGHVSAVVGGGKYEVTVKDLPIIFPSVSNIKKATEPPAPKFGSYPPLARAMKMTMAKYSNSWKFIDTTAYTPHLVVGGVIGGMSIVGLSMFVRKLTRRRQQSDNFAFLE